MSNIIQAFPKGSGSGGGHTILDSSGTAVAQESNLQFVGLSVTDNSTDEITEVAGEGLNADSIDDIASANTINPAVIIGDANNYSTSEKIVGKWIDGKTLYQKTYITNTPSATTEGTIASTTIEIQSLNYDQIVNIKGVFKLTSNSVLYCFNLPVISGSKTVRAVVDETHTDLLIQNNSLSYNNMPVYVTLQYTKTT